MALRTVPVHRAGNRPNLFLGWGSGIGDVCGSFGVRFDFFAQELRATAFGVGLWVVALFLFRLMAKADPQMRYVYMRHRRYKAYYPARSTPFRGNEREFK